jgi:hypothetical protein
MKSFDKILHTIMQNDRAGVQPAPAIEDRLSYAYRLKKASSGARRNSIIPGLSGFLTGKYLVFKITAVAAFFILTFHFQPWETSQLKNSFICDTTKTLNEDVHVQDSSIHKSYSLEDSVLIK